MSETIPQITISPEQRQRLNVVLASSRKEETDAVSRGKITPSYLASPLKEYQSRMHITEELKELAKLFPFPAVWDVGAGSTDAVSQLKNHCGRNFKFLAINPHFLPLRSPSVAIVPLIISSTEQLAGEASRKARELGLYPPSAIILSNALMYSHFGSTSEANLLQLAILNIDAVLPQQGRVFIYEDGGEGQLSLYEQYIQKIKELHLGFQVQRKAADGFCKTYLKCIKQ